jgi:hypothetical protein
VSSLQEILDYRIPKIANRRLTDPHVVIIGAGASKAACPIDTNGKRVPLLKNVLTVIDAGSILHENGFDINGIDDFERFYSDISQNPNKLDLCNALETLVYKYFSNLQLPSEINLYDYLVLSLTEKDIIISFNWDPFLLQAYRRNIDVGNLPQIVFPHGNVGVGVCYNCKCKGYYGYVCSKCYNNLKKMKLLYPVEKKDYNNDVAIKNEWNVAREYLRRAAGLTIFGYGAPVSDVLAVEMLREALDMSNTKKICLVEIVNLLEVKNEQLKKWERFYDPSMIIYINTLQETALWRYPRVSLETLFDAILQQHPRSVFKPYREFLCLSDLQQFIKTITEFELWFPDKEVTYVYDEDYLNEL